LIRRAFKSAANDSAGDVAIAVTRDRPATGAHGGTGKGLRRTRPMSLNEAATVMGFPGNRKGREGCLRKAMDEDIYAYEKINRQTYVFNCTDFPESSQAKIKPTALVELAENWPELAITRLAYK
jgi:hypothetical protein